MYRANGNGADAAAAAGKYGGGNGERLFAVAVLAVVLVAGALGQGAAQAADLTGRQIVEEVDGAASPEDMTNRLTMTLVDARGGTRERTVMSWSQGQKRSVMVFLDPDGVRGTAFLRIEEGETDHMWLYLPDLSMTKRIDAEEKHRSFMGTDFTYDDMGDRDIDDYAWTLLSEETHEGDEVYVVEGQAKDPDTAGYSRIVSWIRHDIWKPVKVEYYDLSGELEKVQINAEFLEFGGYWIIGHMEMLNVQTEHRTELAFTDIQVDTGVSAEMFTADALLKLLDYVER